MLHLRCCAAPAGPGWASPRHRRPPPDLIAPAPMPPDAAVLPAQRGAPSLPWIVKGWVGRPRGVGRAGGRWSARGSGGSRGRFFLRPVVARRRRTRPGRGGVATTRGPGGRSRAGGRHAVGVDARWPGPAWSVAGSPSCRSGTERLAAGRPRGPHGGEALSSRPVAWAHRRRCRVFRGPGPPPGQAAGARAGAWGRGVGRRVHR